MTILLFTKGLSTSNIYVIIGLKLLLTVIIIKEEHYEPYKICYWQNQILNCCKLLENDINFNFEYHIFSSGEDVLKYQSNIDILLLDEELPGTSGQSIKEQFEASNKNTIIIFITSHNEIVYDSFGKNVYGFITKPINQTNFNKTLLPI